MSCTVQNCSSHFGNKKLLVKHFRISHSDTVTSYQCSTCLKSFKWISNYKRHLKTHRSMMDANCPICAQPCYKYNVKRHISNFHGPRSIVAAVIGELIAISVSQAGHQSLAQAETEQPSNLIIQTMTTLSTTSSIEEGRELIPLQ